MCNFHYDLIDIIVSKNSNNMDFGAKKKKEKTNNIDFTTSTMFSTKILYILCTLDFITG